MSDASSGEHLWVIGAGRMGIALGSLLQTSGLAASLTYSARRPTAPRHPLFCATDSPVRYQPGLAPPSPPPTAILIAVPDGSVAEVALRVADVGIPPTAVVLHLSGSLGLDVLDPLAKLGCAVGSLHPLAAVPKGDDGAERLRGAWFGVEGEGSARALAERIARVASGRVLSIRAGNKPLYHAAAVFASNYAVVLLDIAERLMGRAGVPAETARDALTTLAEGAVANVAAAGPAAALTGPAARGDAATVDLHLARLSAEERGLYSLLAHQALRLAREGGIDPALAERVEHVLREST